MSDVSDIQKRVNDTRTALENTLDAIEDRLNPRKQANRLAHRAAASYRRNPIPWIATATTIGVAVAGVIVWAFVTNDD